MRVQDEAANALLDEAGEIVAGFQAWKPPNPRSAGAHV
jgi:hypothetical protein